jgi:hypothetical protein
MPILLTLALPPEALERLMDGYHQGDPELMAMLKEFGVLKIMPWDDEPLSIWENEGGK